MSDTNRFPTTATTGYKSSGWTSRQANGYYQYGANGTLSKLQGSHNLKVGGDYRTIGAPIAELRRVDRHLQLHRRLQRQRARRHAARLSAEHEQHPAEHAARRLRPLRVRLRAGRLARDQQADDQLRRPPRARVGPAGANNQFAVNFDQTAVNPLNSQRHRDRSGHRRAPADPRRPDLRRLRTARRRAQGNQPAIKAAPRVGARVQPRRQDGASAAAGASTTRRGTSRRPAPPAGARPATRRRPTCRRSPRACRRCR